MPESPDASRLTRFAGDFLYLTATHVLRRETAG